MKLYGILRVFPKIRNDKPVPNTVNSVFYEFIGNKRDCKRFYKKATKKYLHMYELTEVKEPLKKD